MSIDRLLVARSALLVGASRNDEPVPARQAHLSILSARGLACIMLVAYHVVGANSDSGLRLPESSWWHHATASFDFVRMPLFSVLSGYLYAMRRPTAITLVAFSRGKVRRILLPFMFATIITLYLRSKVYGSDDTLSHALLFHYQHFWFLQALLLIFAFMAIWDVLKPPTWCGLFVISFVAVMLERSTGLTDFLSVNGAVYLLPFFCCGMILRLEPKLLASERLRSIAVFVLITVIAAQQSGLLFGTAQVLRNSVPASMAGYAVSVLVLVYLPSLNMFNVIGRFSYAIYIWHSIFAAAARTWLNAIIILPVWFQFVIVLTVGMLLPILLQLSVNRVPFLSTLMFGQNLRRKSNGGTGHFDVPHGSKADVRDRVAGPTPPAPAS